MLCPGERSPSIRSPKKASEPREPPRVDNAARSGNPFSLPGSPPDAPARTFFDKRLCPTSAPFSAKVFCLFALAVSFLGSSLASFEQGPFPSDAREESSLSLAVDNRSSGGAALRDFSLTILIGLIVGTHSSIFVASPVVHWVAGQRGGPCERADRRPGENRGGEGHSPLIDDLVSRSAGKTLIASLPS